MKKIFIFLIFSFFIISCQKDKTPTADFSFSGLLEVGVPVNFKNLSSNSESYLWEFGDGFTSSSNSPSHIYSKPGNYGISLIVTGNGASASTNKSAHITGTTFSITNMTSVTLYNFGTFYWNGTNIEDIKYLGTLEPGGTTGIVITKKILVFFVFNFEPDGNHYYSAYPYILQQDAHNDLTIINETEIFEGNVKSVPETFRQNLNLKIISSEFKILTNNRPAIIRTIK